MEKKKKKLTKLEKYLSKKISNNRKDTAGVAALTIGDLLYDMGRVDPLYIRGAQFARPGTDINTIFEIGKQNLKDLSEKGQAYFDKLHSVNYTGGVHEFVTDQWMLKNNVEITMPETMNQAGWDRIYNGQKWQIKFGSVENVREARLKYEEYPVATDLETAEIYHKKFPEDSLFVLGTTPRSLTQNIVSEGSEASMEVYEDDELFETGAPEFFGIASIVSVFKNISYLSDKKTDLYSGVQNVIMDTAGRGALMMGGAKAGGLILGIPGAIVGGIGGAIFSREWINKFKIWAFCEKERDQLKKDIDKYINMSKYLMTLNFRVFDDKRFKLFSLSSDSIINKFLKIFRKKKAHKKKTIPGELCDYLAKRMDKERKEKEYVFKKLDSATTDDEEEGSKYRWLHEKFTDLSDTKLPEVAQIAI
jgi:hypothetical protein|tara:strand:- start:233 stop:1489 length:1257 start_codon:yes stop_codon:yes gene_type:complete